MKKFFEEKSKGNLIEQKVKRNSSFMLIVSWVSVDYLWADKKLLILEFFTSIFFFLSFFLQPFRFILLVPQEKGKISFHGVFAGWHRLQRTLVRVFLTTNWKILPISPMKNCFSERFSSTKRENLKAK